MLYRTNKDIISGISNEVRPDALETFTIKILSAIGVTVTAEDIEGCHRLANNDFHGPKKTIICFCNRKKAIECFRNKKKLCDLDLSTIGLAGENNIFIFENLCPAYQNIYDFCRMLRSQKYLKYLWTYNGTINIRVKGGDESKTLLSIGEVYDFFPCFK